MYQNVFNEIKQIYRCMKKYITSYELRTSLKMSTSGCGSPLSVSKEWRWGMGGKVLSLLVTLSKYLQNNRGQNNYMWTDTVLCHRVTVFIIYPKRTDD